ncbi:hypothetical protein LCGC14_2688120, partial [marine sediment metagenome]
PDRTNGIIYFVDCEYDGTTSYVWSLTLSDDSIEELDSIPYDVNDIFLIGNDIHVSYVDTPAYELLSDVIRPDGEVSAEWHNTGGGYNVEAINEIGGADGSYLYAGYNEEVIDIYTMSTFDLSSYDSGKITRITIWGYETSYNTGIEVGASNLLSPDPYRQYEFLFASPEGYTWKSATYSGLDFNQADLDDLELILKWFGYTPWPQSFAEIETLYAEVFFEGDFKDTELHIKNINQGTSVSQIVGPVADRSYNMSQVVVVGTDVYFLWKWSDNNVELLKYDSSGGIITQQLNTQTDFGPNTNLPPIDQRGLSYDENNIISFVLDDGSNTYYYYTYSISDDAFTKGVEYNISLMLDRNTASTVREKGLDLSEYKLYYIDTGGILTLFATPDLDAPIIAITDNFLMTSNGKLYERLESFADITKTITNGFLNQYDIGYPNYK